MGAHPFFFYSDLLDWPVVWFTVGGRTVAVLTGCAIPSEWAFCWVKGLRASPLGQLCLPEGAIIFFARVLDAIAEQPHLNGVARSERTTLGRLVAVQGLEPRTQGL